MEQWRDELYHHGIQGQKWGVQNGPPYPLDYNDHSDKEKRLMKKDARKLQKRINESEKIYAHKSVSARHNKAKADDYNFKGLKTEKLVDINKAEMYYKAYMRDMTDRNKAEEYTNSIIKEIMDKGYGLYSLNKLYDTDKGGNFGWGAAFGAASAAVRTKNTSEYINKFRVVSGDVKEQDNKLRDKDTPLHEYHYNPRATRRDPNPNIRKINRSYTQK